MSAHFDVVVVGAGPGGYVAAIRAAQLGLNTAIIEKQWWGGVCLNVGCIPTKSLLRNAEIAHIYNKEADLFGNSGEVTFDYGKAFSRSRSVSDRMVKGIHFLMKKNKITELNGWGTFVDANTVEVESDSGEKQRVRFRSAIIAEGCHIKAGARVGDYVEGEERKISVIGKDKIIAEGTVIDAGAIV